MKDDVIYRQAAIDAKQEFRNPNVMRSTEARTAYDRTYANGWNDCNSAWIDVVKDLPSAQPEHNPDDERKIADLHKMVNYLLSQLEQRWIPCSERLPEESDGTVLVCFPDEFPYNNKEPYVNAKHNQRVRIASYSQFSNMWYIDDFNAVSEVRPIAWMPRPKPYKGDDTE